MHLREHDRNIQSCQLPFRTFNKIIGILFSGGVDNLSKIHVYWVFDNYKSMLNTNNIYQIIACCCNGTMVTDTLLL